MLEQDGGSDLIGAPDYSWHSFHPVPFLLAQKWANMAAEGKQVMDTLSSDLDPGHCTMLFLLFLLFISLSHSTITTDRLNFCSAVDNECRQCIYPP